jgi:hypothetical protein
MNPLATQAIPQHRHLSRPLLGKHMPYVILDEDEKTEGRVLLEALDVFRTVRPTMPLQYVHTFCVVALDEGRSVAHYARRAGVSASVMSRHLLDLGRTNRHGTPGFGLVTCRNHPGNQREKQFVLTDEGEALYGRIADIFEKGLRPKE